MNQVHGNAQVAEKPPTHSSQLKARHLVKRLQVRQYIHDKETASREPSRFELFFDLVFVALFHQLTELAAEAYDGINLAKFVVLLWIPFSVWNETRLKINVHGTDDLLQRFYILATMALLLGYSANASTIELPSQHPESEEEEATGSGMTSLRAAILFFLISKATRFVVCLVYALQLPRFRSAILSSAAALSLTLAIYFPLIFTQNKTAFWILTSLGIAIEIGGKYGVLAWTYFMEARDNKRDAQAYWPAISIEHYIERTTLFVVVVTGEAILNTTYRASSSEAGLHDQYGRAVLGLVCAFCLTWLYFDQDSAHTFIHAIRRSAFTAITYNYLHFPLISALILWSAALAEFVKSPELEHCVRYFFSGSMSTALVVLAIFGWLHQPCDLPGTSLIPHQVRIVSRLAIALIIALLPLADTLDHAGKTLGICAALLVIQSVMETVGKIGAKSISEGDLRLRLGAFEDPQDQVTNAVDLTELERGEEDAGMESALKSVVKTNLPRRQRLALSAI